MAKPRVMTRVARLRRDSTLRRRAVFGLVGAFVFLAALLTVIVTFMIMLASKVSFTDRLTATSDIFAGSTLLLTIIAALVALRAYAVSTGLPDLELLVEFPGSEPNNPRLYMEEIEGNHYRDSSGSKQTKCSIYVHNKSRAYSARNPAVVVLLVRMAFEGNEQDLARDGWTVIERDDKGMSEVQWDGGSTYSIHGRSVRKLPIDMTGLRTVSGFGEPMICVALLAEGGYRKDITIPVGLLIPGKPDPPFERRKRWL
jgi:hypothetical protein